MGPVLVLGANGMLGRALMRCGSHKGLGMVGAAKQEADIEVDVTDVSRLADLINEVRPETVINTVAVVSIETCEQDPKLAYEVNARPAAVLARLSSAQGFRNVHISTDHFFIDGGNRAHREEEAVTLVNEYARTKYAAECFALTDVRSLVVRTNIVGPGRLAHKPSFGDWVRTSIEKRLPMTLFEDAFHSPIHVDDMSAALFKLLRHQTTGVINLAGSEVVSKADFVTAIANAMNVELDWVQKGSARTLKVPRAMCAGLDVNRAQSILGSSLPSARRAAALLVSKH